MQWDGAGGAGLREDTEGWVRDVTQEGEDTEESHAQWMRWGGKATFHSASSPPLLTLASSELSRKERPER